MSQEVILLVDVAGLGAQGEVVKVQEGHARNYLLPRKLAAPVTPGVRRQLEKLMKERAAEELRGKEAAQGVASMLEAENFSCTVKVKTGPEGKLYGSVTSADLAAALKKDHGIKITKTQISLDEPIKELGVFKVKVALPHEVQAILKVSVVAG